MQNQESKENPILSVLFLVLLIILVFAFKSSILDANNIPSGSMIPTLKIGDYLFVNKMRYSLRVPFTEIEIFRYDNPKRGDIITFIPPHSGANSKNYVKRLIGIPGDRIRITGIKACALPLLSRGQEVTGKKSGGGNSGTDNPSGQTGPVEDTGGKPGAEEAVRDYQCGSRGEPTIAFVEYRENDSGPWKNFAPRLEPARWSENLLQDSDNEGVLHPRFHPPGTRHLEYRIPILLEERIGGIKHLLVETSDFSGEPALCDTIVGEGCVIPEGKYLVMGDNRDDSRDSRQFGYISRDQILGKALLIYFSINWQDKICAFFSQNKHHIPAGKGIQVPHFSPEDQRKYCSELDEYADAESIGAYLKRTILFRIPRMSVRWDRILTILK